ncbi:SDR family oxidoreductase [Nocardiopsis composta]
MSAGETLRSGAEFRSGADAEGECGGAQCDRRGRWGGPGRTLALLLAGEGARGAVAARSAGPSARSPQRPPNAAERRSPPRRRHRRPGRPPTGRGGRHPVRRRGRAGQRGVPGQPPEERAGHGARGPARPAAPAGHRRLRDLLCRRRIAPQMVREGAGSIVNITSMSSRSGYAGRSDHAAGKAGVHLLSQAPADELGPHGVRVDCVAPGWIESPVPRDRMAARAAEEGVSYQEVRDRDVRRMALHRIAAEEGVARAVLFLAGDASAATTGAVIDVNAGRDFA